jgi:hypothetical protein
MAGQIMKGVHGGPAVLLILRYVFPSIVGLLVGLGCLAGAPVDDRYDCYVSKNRLFKNDI